MADNVVKGEDGKSLPIWVTVTLWGKEDGSPHGVAQYIHKGTQLESWGQLGIRAWEAGGKSGIEYFFDNPQVQLVGNKVEAPATSDTPHGEEADPFADE